MPLEGSRERITYIQPHDIISKGKHYLHSEVGQIMTTKLERISELSKQHPEMKFNSIGHLINIEMLKECHYKMDGRKAVGIDGISKEEYNSNLDNNLKQLVEKLKNKSYRPKPARKVEIPKENGKTRPLSIYSYEDKLVQEALRKVLESVFEPHFYSNMCGFRPNRNCHGAIRKLNDMIEGHKTNYILDADIKGFFDNLNHDWIMKFISSRITDNSVLRLVEKMLKAGILKNGEFYVNEFGAGQGGLCRARHNPPCGVPTIESSYSSSIMIPLTRYFLMIEITSPSLIVLPIVVISLSWFTVSKNFSKSMSTIQSLPSFIMSSAVRIACCAHLFGLNP